MNIYFDNAATTIVCEEATAAVIRVMREVYGNPSSPHYMGRAAASILTNTRKVLANAISVDVNEIYYTVHSIIFDIYDSIARYFSQLQEIFMYS